MLVPPLSLAIKDFAVEHLDDSPENLQLIRDFACSNNAMGLELYLKQQALNDEDIGQSRTYLVKDALTRDLACYFSLRTCLIPYELAGKRINLSAIELANFAVNDNYRRSQRAVAKIGEYVFVEIIRPLAKHISTCVGAGWLCVFALPKERLIDYYKKNLGFSRLPADKETLVYGYVKPEYDKDCIFMYQRI